MLRWLLLPDFSVYPNPAHDELQQEYAGPDSLPSLALYDLAGLCARHWSAPARADKLAVGDLPRGLYLLRADDKGRQATQRVEVR